jgi:hypothetical protein
MAIDQPMGFRDRFSQVMAEFKQLAEANPLEWQVKLTPEGGPSPRARAAAEGIERTREDAQRAKGERAADTGLPMDKLSTSLDKLSKAIESLGGKIEKIGAGGRGGSQARKRTAEPGEPPEPEAEKEDKEKAGYVSPWLARSLMTDPGGAMKGLLQSWMTGGAGAGAKAPAHIMDFLKGSGGTFEPGKALAGEAFGTGEGAASQFMSPGAIKGTGIFAFLGSFIETTKKIMDWSKPREDDARKYIEDTRFGRGIGMDWRLGTWGGYGAMKSRKNINIEQIRDVFGTAGVGTEGFGGGEWQKAGLMQEAVSAALNAGISNQQMGALLGAGVRGGTFVMGGNKEDEKDYRKYLESIAKWTQIGAQNNISSSDSLRIMAEVSQMGQRGLNILTAENRTGMLQTAKSITEGLPREMRQTGATNIMQELTAAPKGDRQKAMFMAQFLGSNGKLTPESDKLAQRLLKDQYANIKKTYGEYSDYTIARVLADSGAGSMEARISMDAATPNVPAPLKESLIGMSPLNYANLKVAQAKPGFGERIQLGTGAGEINPSLPVGGLQEQHEIALSMLREVQERSSALTAETAETFRNMAVSVDDMKKKIINWADETKNIFFDWVIGKPGDYVERPRSTTYERK